MVSEQELIEKLIVWLKKNQPATLASKLGYRSTGTILTWVKKNKIPPHMQSRVFAIINKGVN